MKEELIYLATPYSHPDPEVMKQRFHSVNKVAAKLMKEGLHIFSPISHSHPIAIENDLPTNWEYWESYDRAFLKASRKLIVLKLDGWENSVGVTAEIKIAKELGIEIEYIENTEYPNAVSVDSTDLFAGFDPHEHELLTMDGYDDCVVGVVERFGQNPIVCYDREKVICRLQADGMDRDEAEEFFQFNQIGAWVGDSTPCFLSANSQDQER